MSVSCGLFVDRTAQIKHLDDSCWSQIEVFANDLYQFSIGQLAGSEGINSDRSRSCNTDSIGELDLTLVSKSCCNDVLCCVTCCISCRTIYLGAVFSGECSAAVTGISTIGVYDDLTSGQTTVSVRSSDNETASRVDEELGVCIYHVSWKDRIEDIFLDILMDLFLRYFFTMLSGQNNCLQTDRFAVLIIFNSNLSLSVRTKIRKSTIFTNVGQSLGQFVSQRDGIRHQLRSFVGCVTKHHTLVSSTNCFQLAVIHQMLFSFQGLVNTHSNVCGLLIDCGDHCTVVSIKAIFSSGISNLADGVTDDLLDIYISLGGDLTHNKYQTGGCACLACNTAHGVLCHKSVKDSIGNLVTDLVRMSFSYRFRSEKNFLFCH